jgi:hypothetical protein
MEVSCAVLWDWNTHGDTYVNRNSCGSIDVNEQSLHASKIIQPTNRPTSPSLYAYSSIQ